jgi:hypothetical protein
MKKRVCGMTGTFVCNEGKKFRNQKAVKVAANTWVFGGYSGGWFKMVAVNNQGKKRENRYMKSRTITKSSWAKANRGGAYKAVGIKIKKCSGRGGKKAAGIRPGYYKILTTKVHAGASAAQPAGWGLSAWGAHGAVRNSASSWAAVHSGNHWPMVWKIEKSKRTKGTYTIKTTKYGPKSGRMKPGWGLSAWHAHGAVRNGASSRVAVHSGNHWLMDWKIEPAKRTKGAYTIKTAGGPKAGKQPKGWGLAAWQKHGGRRNGSSSWVYVHAGNHWLMDWKLVRVKKEESDERHELERESAAQ